MLNLKGKNIFVSGATGFLGRNLVKYFMNTDVNKIVAFSRTEEKQASMRKELDPNQDRIRFILGDIRDLEKLNGVLQDIDVVVHTAALKQIDLIRYNPEEAILINILGTKNIIRASCNNYVEKIIFISSDKACLPINLYGATKFAGEQLMQFSHIYQKNYDVKLICCRYGNVAGSTGSVIPYFRKLIKEGKRILPLTDINMSRFWFDVNGAINLIMLSLNDGNDQDIFTPKLSSFYIKDLIKALDCEYEIIGNRGSEKLSEKMINEFENYEEFEDYYIINPKYKKIGLTYDCKDNNFLTIEELKQKLKFI